MHNESLQFLEKFNVPKNTRFSSFLEAFKICNDRKLKIIVETGTSRGKTKFLFFNYYNWKDGMSTPMFAEYAYGVNGELHTCDISKINIKNSKKFTKKFQKNVNYYCEDSLEFLKNFSKKIDFLYLDSLDGHDIIAASKHQLEEIKIAHEKLHENSIVLLDDKGKKTNLSIDYLLKIKYQIVYETDHQVLLSKTK